MSPSIELMGQRYYQNDISSEEFKWSPQLTPSTAFMMHSLPMTAQHARLVGVDVKSVLQVVIFLTSVIRGFEDPVCDSSVRVETMRITGLSVGRLLEINIRNNVEVFISFLWLSKFLNNYLSRRMDNCMSANAFSQFRGWFWNFHRLINQRIAGSSYCLILCSNLLTRSHWWRLRSALIQRTSLMI